MTVSNVGSVIAAERRCRGWSQARLASVLADAAGRATVTRHDVSRWERGERTPRFWLPYLARVFDAELVYLERLAYGASGSADVPLADPDSTVDSEVVVPVRAADGRIVYVPVSRRRFLQGVGAVAAGILAGSIGADSQIPPVDYFRSMRAVLADSDNMLGPRRVIPVVHDHINLMQELRKTHRGADLRALMGAQTEYADLLGWLHQDARDHAAAQFWLDRALEWAHMSGDRVATAFVLARKSQLAGDMGDGAEAVGAGEAAGGMSESRSRFAAIAATYTGYGYALQGEGTESSRSYDAAHTLLDDAEPDDEMWGAFFNQAYIRVHDARARSALGDYRQAAEQYQDAIAEFPAAFRRDQGVYLARGALAYAGDGDAERGAALGMRSLAIGAETGSGRAFTELTRLRDKIGGKADVPGVTQFCDALSSVQA